MPPLPKDEDERSGSDSGDDEIPAKSKAASSAVAESDDAEENGAEDTDTEVYVVEKILQHDWHDDGTLMFEVKWQGYDKPKDTTWETEENLETADAVLQAYYKKKKGRPVNPNPPTASKRKRKSSSAAATPAAKKRGPKSTKMENNTSDAPVSSGRGRPRKVVKDEDAPSPAGKKAWQPPEVKSWEDLVMAIDTVEETFSKDGERARLAYVVWNDGHKSRHPLVTLNSKCPQKMLQYYEQHLVFKQNVGDTMMEDESFVP